MLKTISRGRKLPMIAVGATAPLSSTTRGLGILSDEQQPIDKSKEGTDTIGQAKNDEGATPAQQHAKATGHPVNESSGNPQQSSSKSDSPGLGSKHAQQGKKPGEEAVNPAVKNEER